VLSDIFLTLAFFFSTNSHLVTPDASRATTPVEDIETFDPCRPSLNPGDSVLLPIGKIPGYLDVALKALTLHTEARTSFITYAYSPLPSSYPMSLTGRKFSFLLNARVLFFPPNLTDPLPLPAKKTFVQFITETDGNSVKLFRGLDYLGTADIGCRLYLSTNTSPCASSRKQRTKRRRRCASRPRPMSSHASSCSSAESAQMMWALGPRRRLARLRKTARRSGRGSSASMRCARPIARCSVCWSGAGWKLGRVGDRSPLICKSTDSA
jgi:hypothetical protein